jgi:hypothetical protein
MTPEQLQQLIALLSQQMGSINPSLMASAMPANNVSPANIASAMNPNVLLSSGLVDPSTVQAGIDSVYQQMLADWESRNNANLPPEASDLWLSPITSKYVGRTDEVGTFMNEVLTAVKNGQITVDKLKAGIANGTIGAPAAATADYGTISADLDQFGKLVDTQNQAKLKFQITQSQKGIASAPAPSIEQARYKYYKDLGAPEMALLPDAGATYQFDPSLFGDQAKTSNLAKLAAEQQAIVDKGPQVDLYEQNKVNALRQGSNIDQATRLGDVARQKYLAENIPSGIDDWTARTSPVYSRKRDAADALAKQTMQRVLSQLNKTRGNVSVETPEYTKSSKRLAILQDAQLRDVQYKQDVANLVAQKLAAQGRTPNQDVMNQLLGYASMVNQKK